MWIVVEHLASCVVDELLTQRRMRALPSLCLAPLIVGACAYQADSFTYAEQRFRGQHVTIDCLDLAIERRPVAVRGRVVLAYEFGNRCDQPAVVDLSSVRIVGRATDGATIELAAYDPRRQIRPARLDGRSVGREAIAYSSTVVVRDVCLDAAAIAHASPSQWICFGAVRP